MMRRYRNTTPRRLYRDPERGILLGVCAGVAEAVACPAWLVRIAALAALWFYVEPTVIAYALAALLLPVRPLRFCGRGDEASFWRSNRHGERA